MPHPEHQLRVIYDTEGKKIAEKLHDRYIRQDADSYHRLPEFLIALDGLLASFSGKPAKADEEDDDNHGHHDGDQFDGDGDVDDHGGERWDGEEASAQDRLREAIASVLRKR